MVTAPAQPERPLRQRVAEALDNAHRTHPCTCGSTIYSFCVHEGALSWTDRRTAAALAAVQPDLDARDAEIQQLRAAVDELTTEIAEGISAQTMLKGLNIHDGQVHLEVEPAREMLLILVASMRTMLDDAGAENYLTTEAEFPPAVHLDLQDGQHPDDAYTLTVQRRHRPTAHDLRRRAEAENEQLRAELAAHNDLFDMAGRVLATSALDWSERSATAWLWGVINGWDCNSRTHDDTCVHGAMEEQAAKHGWDAETVATIRRFHAAITYQPPAAASRPTT